MPEDRREEDLRKGYESDIIRIIRENVEPAYRDKVTLEAEFEKTLGLDSLERVELQIALDEHFGLHTPDNIASTFTTGRKVADYLTNPEAYIASNRTALTPKQ